MVSFTQLNQQNDKITELSNVLNRLIGERYLCDMGITSDLFFQYVGHVRDHLDQEERELYQTMLLHKDQDVRQTANKFLSGSGEIKRVFGQYLKRWCKHQELHINNHEQFVKDSEEMFQLVLRRIEDEVEHLYPTVRVVQEQKLAA